jgi:hypothetical protein
MMNAVDKPHSKPGLLVDVTHAYVDEQDTSCLLPLSPTPHQSMAEATTDLEEVKVEALEI